MVTAADGAEEFYNFDNATRFETAAEAVERDRRLRQAYLGHNRYMVVNNQAGNFEKKISSAISHVAGAIGLPTDVSLFKKYLVDPSLDVSDGHRRLNIPDDIGV